MVKLYVSLIRAGRWTLDRVPLQWREAVRAALGGDGKGAETP